MDPGNIIPNIDWALVESWAGTVSGRFAIVVGVFIGLVVGAYGVKALKDAVFG